MGTYLRGVLVSYYDGGGWGWGLIWGRALIRVWALM